MTPRHSACALLVGLALSSLAVPSQAEEKPSDGASVALAVGRAERRAGAYKEAVQDLRRAAGFTSGNRDAALQASYELARISIDRRDFSLAMAQCKSLGQKPSGAALGHACAAEAFLLWRRGSEALAESRRALAIAPRLYEAKVAEGRARVLELSEAEAASVLEDAISIAPERVEARLALAELHALLGRADAAVSDARAALSKDEQSPEAHAMLGRVLPAGPEAAGELEAALKIRPNYSEALARLADVQIAMGQLDRARESAERALKSDPNDASMRIVVGRVALAEAKPEAAHVEAKAALAILPNLASAKLLDADAYAKEHEIDLALESYQAAYGLDRTDPTPLVRASAACRAEGRDTSARAFADKATREFPNYAPGWLALGDALVAQKESAEAKQAYAQAASKARGAVESADARRRIQDLK